MKKIILLLVFTCLPFVCSYAQKKILFVTSNQHFYGDTEISASNHFGEIVVPYDLFLKAGFAVDFVSPQGGAIPIGYLDSSDSLQKKYLYDGRFMDRLEYTMKPLGIKAGEYFAIFYSGGGAAMFGVAEDTAIQEIARDIYSRNGAVSTVCHGTAGIAYLRDKNGKSLYAGRKITGYPDYLENKEMRYYKTFPFSMDKAIKNNGGDFVYEEKTGKGFYMVDGRFVTGQDPTSAVNVANAVITILKANFKD